MLSKSDRPVQQKADVSYVTVGGAEGGEQITEVNHC